MRHRFRYLDPEIIRQIMADQELQRIFNQLVLAAGGDAEQAMDWMRQIQEQGYLPEDLDLEAFFQSLADQQMLQPNEEGQLSLTSGGERRIRKSAFEQIFSGLERAGPGYHPVRSAGEGLERLPETRPYRFGDDIHHLDAARSLQNSLRRHAGTSFDLGEEDLEVFETEHLTSCATIVAIDISHSMVLYGEDRITPAKTVALALTELITTQYPKDHLGVILFGDRAEKVELSRIPYIDAGPYHTNTAEALELSRALLARQRQPNKQIFLITDGKPSAMTEAGQIYKNPFGLDMRIINRTLEEADSCRRQKVVITTFMIATDPTLTAFVEKMTKINRGRAYFASPYNLGEFILADYIRNRRQRVR
ncbi:MAG: VWA domain-containing protein [Deltaproteobacteria bacterium]|nr:VWA domain-containing protein [Deltaproteobacteria bacterium]